MNYGEVVIPSSQAVVPGNEIPFGVTAHNYNGRIFLIARTGRGLAIAFVPEETSAK